jgi:hypothetical protein
LLKSEQTKSSRYAICLASGFDLKKGKRYRVTADPELESSGLIRVVDDSGDDYVYLARRFELVR